MPKLFKPLKIEKFPSPPKSFRKLLGPSFILVGLGIGAGELILWPYLISNWGLGIIWGALLGITMQFFLNMEIERYTLVNGESVFVGFARLFKWLPIWFIASSVIAFAWPGFAAASAAILAPVLGINNSTYLAIGMLILVGLFLTLGPVLYKSVETFEKGLVIIGVPLLVLITVLVIDYLDVFALGKGLAGFGDGYFFLPRAIPLMSFLAAFAYSGAGGNLNLAQSFYIKEKGYGMGMYSGRITSLITGKQEKINIEGATFDATNRYEVAKFKKWWKVVNIEHAVVFWGLGLTTMLMLALLAYSTAYGTDNNVNGLNFVFKQAVVISATIGKAFGIIMLVLTSLFLFSTQLVVIDAVGRIVSENYAILKRSTLKSKAIPKVYYYTIWSMLSFAILVLMVGLNQPRLLIILGATLNAICMFVFAGLLIPLNKKLLPKVAQPSLVRVIIVLVTFVFFGIFSFLVIRSELFMPKETEIQKIKVEEDLKNSMSQNLSVIKIGFGPNEVSQYLIEDRVIEDSSDGGGQQSLKLKRIFASDSFMDAFKLAYPNLVNENSPYFVKDIQLEGTNAKVYFGVNPNMPPTKFDDAYNETYKGIVVLSLINDKDVLTTTFYLPKGKTYAILGTYNKDSFSDLLN